MYDLGGHYEDFEPFEASAPSSQPRLAGSEAQHRSGRPPFIADQSAAPSFSFATTRLHVDPFAEAGAVSNPYFVNHLGDGGSKSVAANSIVEQGRDQSFADRFSSVLNAPLPTSLRDSPLAARRVSPKSAATPRRQRLADASVGYGSASKPVRSPGASPNTAARALASAPIGVHEALHQEGRVIRQYKEALREEAIRRELSTLRSPRISRYAIEREEMRAQRGVRQDVVERMEERVQKAKERKAVREEEILAQRARQAALQEEGDDESFADSLELDADHDGLGLHAADERRAVRKGSAARRMPSADGERRRHATPREGAKSQRTPFQPRLTGKGRRAISKVTAPDFIVGWKHRQDQKVDHRRTETVLKEVAACQEAPGISSRSRLLAARADARDGLAGLAPLEAMLERDRLRKLAQWERRQMQEAEANLFHPRITLYAATLGAESTPYSNGDAAGQGLGSGAFSVASASRHQRAQMPVSERLYSDAFAFEERRTARQRLRDAAEADKDGAGKEGRRSLDGDGRGAARGVAVEDRLLERHAALRAAHEERTAQLREAERALRQPIINPVSEAITARLSHTAAERLTSGHRSIFERPLTALPSDVPSPDARRGGKVLTRNEEMQFAARLAAYEERRRENRRRLQAVREGEALAECTFAPLVTDSTASTAQRVSAPPQGRASTHAAPAGDDSDLEGDLERYFAMKEERLRRREGAAEGGGGGTDSPLAEDAHSPLPAASGSQQRASGPVEERTHQWLQRRDARLAQLREESAARRAAEEMPPPQRPQRVQRAPSSRSSSVASDTIYADNRPWGADAHVRRQEESRRQREEREERLSGRPKPSAVGARAGSVVSRGPSRAPTASAERQPSVQRMGSEAAARPASLQPPVAPGDVRGMLGLDSEDIDYLYRNPSPEAIRQQQRRYEEDLAGLGPARDHYIARHSTGVLIPPSLW